MARHVFQECLFIVVIGFLVIPMNARIKCNPVPDDQAISDDINALKSNQDSADQKVSSSSSSEKKSSSSIEEKASSPESLEKRTKSSSSSSSSSTSSEKKVDETPPCSKGEAASVSAEQKPQSSSDTSQSAHNEQKAKNSDKYSSGQSDIYPDERKDQKSSSSSEQKSDNVNISAPSTLNPECNKEGASSNIVEEHTKVAEKSSPKEESFEEPVAKKTDSNIKILQRANLATEKLSVQKDASWKGICSNLPDTVHINPNSEEIPNQHEDEAGFDLTDEEIKKFKIWPQGIIPYYIDHASFDNNQRDRLRLFLEKTNSLTGLRFVELLMPPTTSEDRFVFFINRRGINECMDYTPNNFTNQHIQRVIVGYNCLTENGGPASAILALVGITPMHNAPNRDEYIQINEKNIFEDKKYLFDTVKNQDWLFHDIPYDYASAGHYDWHKYSLNGIETITPKFDIKEDMFSSPTKFSSSDIWKIRMLYNYISRNTHNKVYRTRCQQLQKAGKKVENDVKMLEKVLSRKKPSKYLNVQTKTGVLRNKTAKNEKEKITVFNAKENVKCTKDITTDLSTKKPGKFKKVKASKVNE